MDAAAVRNEQPVPGEQDATGPSGVDMLARVTELYFLTEGKRTGDETNSFGIVLEKMAYDANVERRAALANRLAFSKDAPARLMRRMAFDDILVARPVLQYSPCLNDADLETLASKLGPDHMLAIAHRLHLPARVADLLVRRGESQVRLTITQNTGAELSPDAIQYLADHSEADPELRFALGLRPDLSPGLFERFSSFVADQFLIEVPEAPGEHDAAGEPGGAAWDGEGDGPGSASDGGDTSDSAGADPHADETVSVAVNEGDLVRFAKEKRVPEAITCMARLTRLDRTMIDHCLLKAELSALMVLCKAHGFANGTFSALLQLRISVNEGGGVDQVAMLKRYDAMKTDTAKRIIQYAEKKKL